MAITGQSGDGTCEVHGCQLERLRNEARRLTEALTAREELLAEAGDQIDEWVGLFEDDHRWKSRDRAFDLSKRIDATLALQSKEPLMTGPRPFQSSKGPVKAPPIPTEEEYRAQQKAKRDAIEARWAESRRDAPPTPTEKE